MILGVATQAVVIGNFFHSFFEIEYKLAAFFGTSHWSYCIPFLGGLEEWLLPILFSLFFYS